MSGNASAWVEARLTPREASSVGVVSDSSMAEPFLASPVFSKMMLSDAFEGRLDGNCLGMALDAGGGIDTLLRSTCLGAVGAAEPSVPAMGLGPVSGSDPRDFRLEDEVPDDRRCGVHERALSPLIVRERGSIGLSWIPR